LNNYDLARVAYLAYCQTVDFKSFQGDPLPEFDGLPYAIQDAWLAAANAVAEDLGKPAE